MTVVEDTIHVVAPTDMEEGFAFDVTIDDGKTVSVVVPEGGVKEGMMNA